VHGYFVRAGDVRRSIIYQVERLRDGASFTPRHVPDIQDG